MSWIAFRLFHWYLFFIWQIRFTSNKKNFNLFIFQGIFNLVYPKRQSLKTLFASNIINQTNRLRPFIIYFSYIPILLISCSIPDLKSNLRFFSAITNWYCLGLKIHTLSCYNIFKFIFQKSLDNTSFPDCLVPEHYHFVRLNFSIWITLRVTLLLHNIYIN